MKAAEMNSPVQRKKRLFIDDTLEINSWDSIEPYYTQLQNREIDSLESLNQWLIDRSELEAAVEEEGRWRYVRMTCDTNSDEYSKHYKTYVTEIRPQLIPISHNLNVKLINSPFSRQLDKNIYFTFLQNIDNAIKLHEEINVENLTNLQLKEQEYQVIMSNMLITYNGKDYTLSQISNFLQDPNRKIREEVYHLIQKRRLEDEDKLNSLFNELINIRSNISSKVGYSNYRDYKFVELGRSDYTIYDCFQFHEAIKTEILPVYNEFLKNKMAKIGLDELRPWDLEINEINAVPLIPFENGKELADKAIELLNIIDPYFADCLKTMKAMEHLDLESRVGKAPGGYNMGMPEIGVPFIFMNAAGSVRDLITMIHESGHAVHSFLSKDLALKYFKEIPMEIAELASMGMELITLDHWNKVFFKNEASFKRAKLIELQRVLSIFPWVATIDKFQHWLYTNPNHTANERSIVWKNIMAEFTPEIINMNGLEPYANTKWQGQLHLFEVPFYYIEYAIAQLGAIAIWKNYKENPSLAISNYKNALSLGYTIPLKELYTVAGIQFNFSKEYIKELATFLKTEIESI
jgi:oligoendopeptidase F